MKKFLIFIFIGISIFAQSNKCLHHTEYAEIYLTEGDSVQSLPPGSTFTKVTCFTTNGVGCSCMADAENDRIKIYKSGVYRLMSSFSTQASKAGVTIETAFFIDNVEVLGIHTARRWINANDHSSATMSCLVYIKEGQYVDIRARHDDGSAIDILVDYGNLNVQFLGE